MPCNALNTIQSLLLLFSGLCLGRLGGSSGTLGNGGLGGLGAARELLCALGLDAFQGAVHLGLEVVAVRRALELGLDTAVVRGLRRACRRLGGRRRWAVGGEDALVVLDVSLISVKYVSCCIACAVRTRRVQLSQ